MTDWQLLQEYAHKGSEAAFAELVARHMNLVYRTCRRDIGDAQLAEDAAQAVFLLLAQKAITLSRTVSVTGWLFNASRLVARNALRIESRRMKHETEAFQEMRHSETSESISPEIEACLNGALANLAPADREVILMRYFDDLSYREIAERLGIIEDTASKRASRALLRMRRYMFNIGIGVSMNTLVNALAEQSTEAAPASLRAATLQHIHYYTAAHPAPGGTDSRFALLQKGVVLTMQATKYKYLILGAVILLLGCLAVPIVAGVRQTLAHRSASAATVTAPAATLTDPAAESLAPSDPATIARREIEQDIAQEESDRERNKWRDEPWDTPGRVIVEGDRSSHVANQALYDTMNAFGVQTDQFAANRTAAVKVESFQIDGDLATVDTLFNEQFTVKVQDHRFDGNAPVGTVGGGGGIERSEWQKIDGKWMDVGPDAISATVAQ